MKTLSKPISLISTACKLTYNVIKKNDKRYIARIVAKDIQHLGPLYIKAGQFVSSRKDVFGKEISEEFASLRDNVIPMSKNEIQEILEASGLEHLFTDVNYNHLASASIGQVHTATIKKTNTKVILKIKRPNIEEELSQQLKFINALVDVMQALNVENTSETKKLLKDFQEVVLDELDFNKEAKNLDKFYNLYRDNDNVIIPKVNMELTTRDIIVMEFVESTDIAHFNGNRRQLAKDIMGLFVDQLLYNGIMHGDPHPGNIRIAKDGKLVMYDFGNVLFLKDEERHYLKELVCQLVIGNTNGVISTMKKIGVQVDDEKMTRQYVSKYMEYMRTIDINTFRTEAMSSGNVKLPLRINNTLVRIIRIFGMIEGTCKELDPKFNYFDLLENYVDSIFIDDEFLLYKINADLDMLFNNVVVLTSNPLSTSELTSNDSTSQQQLTPTNTKKQVTNQLPPQNNALLLFINVLLIILLSIK